MSIHNPFKPKSRFKNLAIALDGLKYFEEKGWLTYNVEEKTATVDKEKFEAAFTISGSNFKKVARIAAAKVFLLNHKDMTPEQIEDSQEEYSIKLLDLNGNAIIDFKG